MSNMSINKLYYIFNPMNSNVINSEQPDYSFSAWKVPRSTAELLVVPQKY